MMAMKSYTTRQQKIRFVPVPISLFIRPNLIFLWDLTFSLTKEQKFLEKYRGW